MRKTVIIAFVLLLLGGGNAFATGIGGHVGLTFRGGITNPTDQTSGTNASLDSNIGYTYGGGLLYGLNNNVAAEIEINHSTFKADLSGVRAAEFEANDISIGGHYRFIGTAPMIQKVVPYLGAGVDIIWAEAKYSKGPTGDADLSVGGHLKAGSDFFLNSNLALNLELRGVLAAESDVLSGGVTVGKFDGSAVLGLFGVRLFF
jgi:outer membrane protein